MSRNMIDNTTNTVRCTLDCYYQFPQRLKPGNGYRCHIRGECPAFCENCVNECKEKDGWCAKFEKVGKDGRDLGC